MQKPVVIGLTGQSGAGKTTLSKYLADRGVAIINADLISRKVTSENSDCLGEIAKKFGDAVLDGGKLNRKALASIVFSDKAKLLELEQIIFPYIIAGFEKNINNLADSGAEYILLDAPTLFESGADKFCDYVISVLAKKEVRTSRIVERDNLTETEAKQRIQAQHDDEFYKSRSDYIIQNDENLEKLENIAEEIWRNINE